MHCATKFGILIVAYHVQYTSVSKIDVCKIHRWARGLQNKQAFPTTSTIIPWSDSGPHE